ncbi:pseudouridine synthase [Myxococcaceae bacterium GXIMD 01537]
MAAERLQKYLARAGVASRRHAEELITAGRVTVNNEKVTELGSRVEPGKDLVAVDGQHVEPPETTSYYLLYKPAGVVTTLSDPQGRPTVAGYLEETGKRLFPVGRLDYDAEGALLFTDDGALAHKLTHPSFQVPRTYLAKVKGAPTAATLEKLRGGVRLEDGMATPTSVNVFEAAERNTWLRIVVAEGRPHLIKRLCAAVGHPVVRLFRPSYAGVTVEGLRPGVLRALSQAEVALLEAVSDGRRQPPEEQLKLPPRRHGRSAPGFEDADDDFEVDDEAPSRPARKAAPERAAAKRPAREERKPRTEGGTGLVRFGRVRGGDDEEAPRGEGRPERREWKPRGEGAERGEGAGRPERREWKPRAEGAGRPERREWKPRGEGAERGARAPRGEGAGRPERREWKPRAEGAGRPERREWKPRAEGAGRPERREWKPRGEGAERGARAPRGEGAGRPERREWKPRAEGAGRPERGEWKPRGEGAGRPERREWKPRAEGAERGARAPRGEGAGRPERREWKPRGEGAERGARAPRGEGAGRPERREWKPRGEGAERGARAPRGEGAGRPERREWKPRGEEGGRPERREWKPRSEGAGRPERREWKPRGEEGGRPERREWKPRAEGAGRPERRGPPRGEGAGRPERRSPRGASGMDRSPRRGAGDEKPAGFQNWRAKKEQGSASRWSSGPSRGGAGRPAPRGGPRRPR